MSVEKIKINSKNLRGTLEQSLTNQITQALNDDDQTVIKFHGIYQQDDRDRREIRAQKKIRERLFFYASFKNFWWKNMCFALVINR